MVNITRNRFARPVNAVDIGLRWGREGYLCQRTQVDPEVIELLEEQERHRNRKDDDISLQQRRPAQIALSARIAGFWNRGVREDLRKAPPGILYWDRTRAVDSVIAPLHGGLVLLSDSKLTDIWPGDEVRLPAGTEHSLGIMTSSTRWLLGLRQ